ncbi:MAG: discoidin domain-containing protein [Myxococcota bacterium]
MSTEEATAQPSASSSEPTPQAPPPTSPASERKVRPLVEWFWRGHSLREAHRELDRLRAVRSVFEERAHNAADFARRALDPGRARAAGSADGIACELYLQTAYWALLALEGVDPTTSASKLPFDLKAAIDAAPRDVLLRAAGGQVDLEQVEIAATLGDYCGASANEQARAALVLQTFAENLLRLLTGDQQRIWLLRLQRMTRLALILLAIVSVVISGWLLADWLEQKHDLARDKAWHTSSTGMNACNSPSQFCDESPNFFFHTVEEKNPWVIIDLGAPTEFSAVRVINRRDCCRDRAAPLVIESSNDESNWKQLARNESSFSRWKASFPKVKARYLRVRIASSQATNLHLAAVRVLP